MKKIISMVIFLTVTILSGQSSEKCNYVCHNGTVVKATNDASLQAHIKHGDTFLGDCSDNIEPGTTCNLLSVKYFNMNDKLPSGLRYFIFNLKGQILKYGKTDGSTLYLLSRMPQDEILFMSVEGYQTKKLVNSNKN